ncbi:MAG: ABC transporter ATP-binding protein [Candidatus Marinimicrobia bacterium]|nr:ABC transporter ATP-binding protein [Candidatus Neomarinimicrobiota bacterium]MCF7840265.1 ABC transporter ATP-binding protein [Candidatus Neomarinimicrobiota bacterium]
MISIRELHKSFGPLQVLTGVSLAIESGKITAILGPNGSGKTTLIKSILGLVKPDRGVIQIGEQVLNGDCRYREDIGYMPQIGHYPENLSLNDVMTMLQDLRGGKHPTDTQLLEKFRLGKEMDKALGTLSGGTRQKVSAVLAMLFNPKILILDEPTSGLDPVASSIFKDALIEERAAGKTIILTSHIMSEVEELADAVVFLLDGKIRFHGSPTEILQNTSESNLERGIARMMQEAVHP